MSEKRRSLRTKPQNRLDTSAALDFAEKKSEAARRRENKSGQVPVGDVRLTANIREDVHLKLKITAAQKRTTIGELLEELVEEHL
jgi:hypothetical protein